AGATATYTNAVPGGSWTSSTVSVATVGSNTGILTGIAAGTATLSYNMPGGCRVTKIVSVSALPGIITGTASTCAGGTTTLASIPTGGIWTSMHPTASAGAATGIITGLSAGTALISYTNAAGCARTTTVTVAAPLPAIAGAATVCSGGTMTLTNTTTGGTWASSSTANATIATSTGLLTGAAAGTATITYRTSTTCYTTKDITVISAPAAITAPAYAVCKDATLQLEHETSGGTWTSSTPARATVSTSGLVSGSAAGTTTIYYSLAPGCATSRIITVNAIPAAITGTAAICNGTTTTLATTSTGGSWLSDDADVATVSSTGLVTSVAPGTATISYKLTATGCINTRIVTVNALPDTIAGNTSICAGASATLTNTATGGSWTSAATAVATIGSTTGILNGVIAGTVTISYSMPAGCRTTKVVTVKAQPTSFTGTTAVCEGATTTLTNSTASQTWSSADPEKATVATGTSITGIVTGVAAGTATISYTNALGCARTIVVTVNTAPAAIVGNNTICAGKTDTLTNTVAGGTWVSSSTSAATIGASTGIITAGASAGNTNISYTLANGCRKIMALTVAAMPAAITGTFSVCNNTTTTLTSATTGGVWSSSNTDMATVATGTGTTGIVTGGTTPGMVNISYTSAAGCPRTVIVTVNATPEISGPDAICPAMTATFTGGTGGTWSSANTAKATIVSTTGVATGVAAGTTTISYKVNATCFATKTVSVHPAVAAITGASVCKDNSVTLTCATPGGMWLTGNPEIASVDGSTGVVTGNSTGLVNIYYQIEATGCAKFTTVNVLPTPAAIEGTTTIAAGASATLTNSVGSGTWTSSASTIADIGAT
ncbi:beta strand repeat-containing protein, partial [Nemorincola caseinilytica]|uniref:beta strand repeat-containing protein n=1 Tax=Nemorincola caseinilytica TaxID=2054315 RepID=UPI0031E86BDD